jgi:acetyl-CoA carboxylase, biotin carboxylase subunit
VSERPPFEKLLVANRGEIAVRVIRTCRRLGIKTVAVYSEADQQSLHVRTADEAVCIGPPRATQSYLAIENILAAAKQTGAEAIHPGYGFLSENALFARRCAEEGLVFVGPSPRAIEAMGNKLRARQLMLAAGVPIVPGSEAAVTDLEEAAKLAERLGYPIILKAAAGGGGRGMRVVRGPSELVSAHQMAQQEAEKSFRDGTIYIEKYFVDRPRHIEIQLLGDQHGQLVYLGERECSIQRRHQKVIEECPSPVVTPELRARMGEAAAKAGRAVDYFSAGTVEFLVDGNLDFYFLEMNTRLQVEHPVTEMVLGMDLVEAMLRVAWGERLWFDQGQVRLDGHAIECRIYAENPLADFMPSPGRISTFRQPGGEGIRLDSGYDQGSEVSIFYDSLVAKLIAWAPERGVAIERMRASLAGTQIEGVETTLPFLEWALADSRFARGEFDTGLVDHWYEALESGARQRAASSANP